MQREKSNFRRAFRQRVQPMVMQADAPGGNPFARGVTRQQFPRGAQQHGAIGFRHAIQPGKDHDRRGTRPDKPRWQWPQMARIGREGTGRRRINRFQGAAWRQALRRRQNLRRRGGCAPCSQDEQR